MKILIATDSFKDSLTSIEACKAISKGLKLANPAFEIKIFPMADGGEGTVEILGYHLKGEKQELFVKDPLFYSIKTAYLLSHDKKTAYIEMAKSSGIQLLPNIQRNPMLTTTYGVGEMIMHAINNGVKDILVFIGGSATIDAGIGMATALGYEFYDSKGAKLSGIGKELIEIEKIVIREDLLKVLQNTTFTVICDVKNKLCGMRGAVFTYGKQKGAQDDDLKVLESGLVNLIKKTNGEHLANIEGAGAAGGLGFGMMAFLHASIFHGIDWVIDFTDFEKEVQEADIIITGEGKIDNQTFAGKLLQGITKCASKYDKPVIGICGSLQVTNEEILQLGLKAAFSITPYPSSIVEAIKETEANLTNTSFNIGKLLL